MRVRLSINLLLRAGFRRLWRSAAFWGAVGVMFAAAVFELAVSYPVRQAGLLDNRYMIFALLSGVVLSAFCSLFTGAEYSDGTMRNKIAVGHSRTAVYLSNLAVCAAAGVLACFGYILPMVVTGVPLLGPFTMSVPSLLWFTLCAFIMTAALCAVFAMIAMLNQNKAAVAVICIFLAYFLLFLGIYFNSRLTEPAIIPAREYIESGQILVREAMPNPAYVQGVKRAIFALLYDLPGCQAVQLVAEAEACPVRLPLLSLGAAAVSTGAGLALFRRKDLK
ncbi:MAG: ABC transporter permease subunit [Oscillospiraceae bacterium]|nr:ABC transporter permease subunit [Oscillospiraceae bacterium]